MKPTKFLAAALVLCGLSNLTSLANGATGELLAHETVKVAKSLSGKTDETTLNYEDTTVAFTGRFDSTRHFDVRLTTIVINDDIVIAANPGELFAELGLEWKARMQGEAANPFYFGYT